MQFVINGMKYETDNMEMVAEVKKWYKVDTILTRALYPGEERGREYACQLWKSKKGNWLLTHEEDYGMKYGQAIKEEEAKNLLMRYATGIYEKLYGMQSSKKPWKNVFWIDLLRHSPAVPVLVMGINISDTYIFI